MNRLSKMTESAIDWVKKDIWWKRKIDTAYAKANP